MITTEELVTGYNTVWILSATAVAVYFTILSVRRIRAKNFQYATKVIMGVTLVAYGTVLSRAFWATIGWLHNIGNTEIVEHLIEGAVSIGIASAVLVAGGYSLHITPVFKPNFPRAWWLIIIGFLSAGFFGGVFMHRLYAV